MSILKRIRRIAKANINLLLDKVEVAEQELESKIGELQEAVNEGRESAASYGATCRRLENELEGLKQEQARLAAEAERALKAGDEQTARKTLTEKVKIAERISQISPGVEQGKKTFTALRENIIKLQEQLKAAKLKLQDLKARKRTAEAQKAFEQHLDRAVTAGGGASFERFEDEVLQAEAEVEIRSEIRGGSLRDVELAQRSRELQVEAELETMRERIDSQRG